MTIRFRNFRPNAAFTLLEVLIAIVLFFMALFAILDVTMQSMRAAHALSRTGPTAGEAAALLSASTNKYQEGIVSDTFDQTLYPDCSWEANMTLVGTNGMYQADIVVIKKDHIHDAMTILLYDPNGSANGGGGANDRMFSGNGQRGGGGGGREGRDSRGNGGGRRDDNRSNPGGGGGRDGRSRR